MKKSLALIITFLLIILISINLISSFTNQDLKEQMKKCFMGRKHTYIDWNFRTASIGWDWVSFDNEELNTEFKRELNKDATFSFDFSCDDIPPQYSDIQEEIENNCTFCYRYADNFHRDTAVWTCAKFSEPALTFNFAGKNYGSVDDNDILDMNISCENKYLQNNFQLCKRYADYNKRDSTDWQCVDFDGTIVLNDFKGEVDDNDDFDLKIFPKSNVANLPPISSTDYSNLSQCQICRRYSVTGNRYGAQWDCVPFNYFLHTAFEGDVNNGDNYDLKMQCPDNMYNLFTLSRKYADIYGRNDAEWDDVNSNGDVLYTDFVGDVNTDDIFDLKIETSDDFLAQNCQLCRRYTWSDTQRERTTIEVPPSMIKWPRGGYEYLNLQCVDLDGTPLLTDFYGDVNSNDEFDLIINCDPHYCIDSDDGINKYVKGSISSSSGTFSDSCYNSTYVIEGYCLDEPVPVYGYIKNGETKKIIWDYNVRDAEVIACPQGYACSDGECIEGPAETCTQHITKADCFASSLNCTWTPPFNYSTGLETTSHSDGGHCCPDGYIWKDIEQKCSPTANMCNNPWDVFNQVPGDCSDASASYCEEAGTYKYCAQIASGGGSIGYRYDVKKY